MVKARELDPIQSEPFIGEAVIQYQRPDYKALLETARAFAAQNSNDWTAHHWVGVGYQGTGQTAEAIVGIRRLSNYRKGIPIPLPRWRTRMPPPEGKRRRKKSSTNGCASRKPVMFRPK
jgi:hypothetical protein